MNITSIPTIMAFKDGIGVFAQAGALPRPVLDDLVSQVRELDMNQVRADLARREAEAAEAAEPTRLIAPAVRRAVPPASASSVPRAQPRAR